MDEQNTTMQQPGTQPAQQPNAHTPAQPREARKDDNVVYIGKKPAMSYVLAVVTNFNRGSQEVVIKARGLSISRAVDVEEIVKHRFMPNAKIKDIRIMTEDLQSRDGHPSKVSALEIVLSKQ